MQNKHIGSKMPHFQRAVCSLQSFFTQVYDIVTTEKGLPNGLFRNLFEILFMLLFVLSKIPCKVGLDNTVNV